MSSITLSLALRGRLLSGTQTTFQGALFGNNEPGFSFEPWDITTLYQDRAGTTPVTAAGQSVGLRLDKSKGLALGAELWSDTGVIVGTGWTAVGGVYTHSAGGDTFRKDLGLVSGKTYQVTFTVSGRASGTIAPVLGGTAAGPTVAANGTYTQRIASGVNVLLYFQPSTDFVGSVSNISVRELAGNHEVAINDAARGIYGWMPKTGRRNKLNATDTLATQSVTVTAAAHTLAFTGTGTVVLSGAYVGTLIGTGASDRVTLTFTPLAASLTLTVTGSVTLAQLQLGSVDAAYQRVVSNYDVTEAGIPSCYYVLANGVNTAYVTPTITPNTDKVQVFAGVRKNSDAAYQIVVEHGTNVGTQAGSFALLSTSGAGTAVANAFGFGLRGSATASYDATSFPAAANYVASAQFDIAGAGLASEIMPRVNGTIPALTSTGSANAGTGNFSAYPAYIYARGGTTLPFNGYDFGHAVRFGPNLDAATIARVEALIARNTPEVTL